MERGHSCSSFPYPFSASSVFSNKTFLCFFAAFAFFAHFLTDAANAQPVALLFPFPQTSKSLHLASLLLNRFSINLRRFANHLAKAEPRQRLLTQSSPCACQQRGLRQQRFKFAPKLLSRRFINQPLLGISCIQAQHFRDRP